MKIIYTCHAKNRNMDTQHQLTTLSWLGTGDLPVDLAAADFEALWDQHPEEFAKVKVFNTIWDTPRWSQSYGNDYTYSGMEHSAKPVCDLFSPFLEWANSLEMGTFDQMLVNWYLNGYHYIGSHSDNEKNLKIESPIIGVSLGGERKFRIRDKHKKIIMDVPMTHGSFVIMGGSFQREMKHEIPKILGKKGQDTGRRISITFRQMK
jgi:alkylated DNA repair dioxygenase AlkB